MENRDCPDCGVPMVKKRTDLTRGPYREFFWYCEAEKKFHGNGFIQMRSQMKSDPLPYMIGDGPWWERVARWFWWNIERHIWLFLIRS